MNTHPAFYIAALVFILLNYTLLKHPLNGGSDSFIGLTAILLIIYLTNTHYIKFAPELLLLKALLTYLSLQLILSYFVAGLVKVKNKKWLSGDELDHIDTLQNKYPLNLRFVHFLKQLKLNKILSVSMIIFELSSPILLLRNSFSMAYLVCGVIFHFIIFITLGLNRFFWTWLTLYGFYLSWLFISS